MDATGAQRTESTAADVGPVSFVVAGRRGRLVRLAITAFLGGLAEAGFLLLVTRAAFAVTEDENRVDLVNNWTIPIAGLLLAALLLIVIRIALAVAASWQSTALTTQVVADTRRRIGGAFLEATWAVQEGQRAGSLQELLTTYSAEASRLIQGVSQTVLAGANLTALLGIAVLIDPLGAVVLVVTVAVLGTVLRPLRRAVRRNSFRSAVTGMEFATSLNEISQLGMELHVFDVQERAEEHIDDLIDENRAIAHRVGFLSGLVTPVYSGIAYAAVLAALAAVTISDFTNLTALGAVMLLMLRSLGYGQSLQSAYASISSTMPSVEELQRRVAYFDENLRRTDGLAIESVGQIDVAGVSFSYGEEPVLHDVSFTIDPHETIGIVGPSGGGKSTLVQLLLGLRLPDEGTIRANDRPIDEYSRASWARKVTFVPQSPHVITGTIEENIRFFRDDVSADQIERASRLAHFHDDVTGFPDGYQRQIGGEHGHLSGGQAQRLTIARALVEEPDLLVLDEPTSALDARSEHLIRTTLHDLRSEATVIIIAHRLSTLDICDRIMVIQNGVLQAFDTPHRLANGDEFFMEALRLSGIH